MSFARRLINVAKVELQDAARKVRTSAEQLLDGPDHEPLDADFEQMREQVMREEGEAPHPMDVPPEIGTYYANLELPVGADAAEVKAAYRRLMRRYHPDKHAANPERAKVAGEVSQRLRTAYEGLTEYLMSH